MINKILNNYKAPSKKRTSGRLTSTYTSAKHGYMNSQQVERIKTQESLSQTNESNSQEELHQLPIKTQKCQSQYKQLSQNQFQPTQEKENSNYQNQNSDNKRINQIQEAKLKGFSQIDQQQFKQQLGKMAQEISQLSKISNKVMDENQKLRTILLNIKQNGQSLSFEDKQLIKEALTAKPLQSSQVTTSIKQISQDESFIVNQLKEQQLLEENEAQKKVIFELKRENRIWREKYEKALQEIEQNKKDTKRLVLDSLQKETNVLKKQYLNSNSEQDLDDNYTYTYNNNYSNSVQCSDKKNKKKNNNKENQSNNNNNNNQQMRNSLANLNSKLLKSKEKSNIKNISLNIDNINISNQQEEFSQLQQENPQQLIKQFILLKDEKEQMEKKYLKQLEDIEEQKLFLIEENNQLSHNFSQQAGDESGRKKSVYYQELNEYFQQSLDTKANPLNRSQSYQVEQFNISGRNSSVQTSSKNSSLLSQNNNIPTKSINFSNSRFGSTQKYSVH